MFPGGVPVNTAVNPGPPVVEHKDEISYFKDQVHNKDNELKQLRAEVEFHRAREANRLRQGMEQDPHVYNKPMLQHAQEELPNFYRTKEYPEQRSPRIAHDDY